MKTYYVNSQTAAEIRRLLGELPECITVADKMPLTRTCLFCRGTGVDPMSDVLNSLPCHECRGTGKEVRKNA